MIAPSWPRAAQNRRRAERLLEKVLADQLAADGAYIQDSFNYQRLFAHSLLFVAWVSRHYRVPCPPGVMSALERTFDFMHRFIDLETGRLPNYGSNDGALIIPLSTCEFRTCAPSSSTSR